jgi:aerobic carbon-monoxide dehydrogenase small subunit
MSARQDIESTLHEIKITLNGSSFEAAVDPRTLLVELIREHAGLTGTHVGCDTSQCGACVVHLNGQSIKSCTIFALQADGSRVDTVESLASGETLHPLQQAFTDCHALQCGFCTPGMLMSSLDLLKHKPDASEREIRDWLDGNMCRCTGYNNIVRAITCAARQFTYKDTP